MEATRDCWRAACVRAERHRREFIGDLRRAAFEMKKPNGDVIKRYQLSRKSVANIVGLLKLIAGKKVARDWEIDLGRAGRPKQRFSRTNS